MIDLGHSRTRDAVVRELFADAQQEWHVRGLARRTGEAPGNVHRELSRLARADWIVRRREGNRVLVRVNDEHPLFAEMSAVVAKTVGIPRVLAAALDEVPGVEWAALIDAGPPLAAASTLELHVAVAIRSGTAPEDIETALRPAAQWLCRELRTTVVDVADLRRLVARREPDVMGLLACPREVLVGDEHHLRALVGGALPTDPTG